MPSISRLPSVGFIKHPNKESRVVLPEPDGPKISNNSPSLNSTLLLSKAVNLPAGESYILFMVKFQEVVFQYQQLQDNHTAQIFCMW